MNKDSRTKNSIRNLTTGFASQIILIAVKFACRTVFISTLGKAYLGINGLFADILTMLSLTELGLDTAINFKLYKPLAENDTHRVQLLMKFYKQAYTVVGFVILLLGLLVVPFLPKLIRDYDSLEGLGINAVLIFGLYLLQSVTSYLFMASKSAIIKADQKEYITNIVNLFALMGMNICQIIVLLVWKSFTLYIVTMVAFEILQNLINAIIAMKRYPYTFQPTKEKLTLAETKDIFKDLGALFILKVNNVVLKATDNLVLSSFIGLAVVGMYSNYLMFYTTIKSLLGKIYNAVKASMGNLFAVSDDIKKNQFFELMNYITMILYGTAAVGVAVLADELMICWVGNDYVIPQPFSILMGIEILFMGIKMNLDQIRNVSGLFRQMWMRPLLGIIVNLGVSIALVRVCGIYGVLIGTITADVLTNFIVDPPIINKYALNNFKPVSAYYIRNIGYILVLTMTCMLDMLLCQVIFPNHGWLSLFVHVFLCAISVPAVMIILFWRTPQAKYIIRAGHKVIAKVKK